jgi:putative spermidine/putrescine transport system permease protein
MTTAAIGMGARDAAPRKAPRPTFWLVLPALLVSLMFFCLPLLENAARSLGYSSVATAESVFTLGHYKKLLTDTYYLSVIGETLKVSAVTTFWCLLLGYPIAYFMVRRAGRLAAPLLFLLVMPLLTSIIMRTFGWNVLFARRGLLNQTLLDWGLIERPINILTTSTIVYVGMVHVMVPFMVLSIVPVLRSVDRRLEESARVLGASAMRTFVSVTLPLSIEGIVTGCLIVFMVTNGSFVTMLLLGNGSVVTLPVLIFQQFSQSQELGFASAMGTTLLVIVLVCLYVQARFAGSTRGSAV